MKYMLFCLFVFMMPVFNVYAGDFAFTTGTTNLAENVLSVWGAPKILFTSPQDGSDDIRKGLVLREGYISGGYTDFNASSKTYSYPVFYDGYGGNNGTNGDKGSIMFLATPEMNEYGAKFCFVQVHNSSATMPMKVEFQSPNWASGTCAWFCVPGHDGPECSKTTSEDDNHSCDTTDYKTKIDGNKEGKGGVRVEKLGVSEVYKGNDSISLRGRRGGTAETVAILDSKLIVANYYHQIVLGAYEFFNHGIKVAPIVLGAVGNKNSGTLSAKMAQGGKWKVLCARGYTKDENCTVSSKQCGVEKLCPEYEKVKFDSNKHEKKVNNFCTVITCKDGAQGMDENLECVSCDEIPIKMGRCDVTGDKYGKCIKCNVGDYFDSTDCTCKPAKVIDANQMKFGMHEADEPGKQCWAMTEPKDITACMKKEK